MIDEKYIINRIRQLCERKHMSMYALSKRSGISQSSLSNLMKRGSTPSFFTLDKGIEKEWDQYAGMVLRGMGVLWENI